MQKKGTTLYNVIFPIWLMMLFPPVAIAALPVNFLIDLLVMWLTMKHLGLSDRKALCKASIFKVWIMGFASDFVGGALMLVWNFAECSHPDLYPLMNAVTYHPFQRWDAFLWVTFCVAVTGAVLYFVHRKFCLKKLPITEKQKHKIALSLAVFTAPYLFYLPTMWFV